MLALSLGVLGAASCVGQVDPAGSTATGTGGIPATPGSPGAGGSAGGSPGSGTGGTGGIGGSSSPGGVLPLAGPPTRSAGARRLTRDELARSLRRLLGADAPVDVTLLPDDTLTPFDNDVLEQSPSMRLVESMETIAGAVADWVTTTPARMARVLPCTPAGPADAACFGRFVRRASAGGCCAGPWTRRAPQEMRELLSYAQAPGSFADRGGNAALRVFLMQPGVRLPGRARAVRQRRARDASPASRSPAGCPSCCRA